LTKKEPAFAFGRNWEEFAASSLNEERILIAQKHLLEFLELPDLRGRYFLDVGCGSGIHSLAAFRAGAKKILSFDVDPDSVRVTEKLKESCSNPASWQVLRGSILDDAFLAAIEPADIVYAWGSLHHTGEMWRAVQNTAKLLKPDGLLYLALYTTTSKSAYWLEIKRKYNRASSWGKHVIELGYAIRHTLRYHVLPHVLRFENPLKTISEYKQNRGMSYWTDVKDWLGGYPYEDAKIEEVLRFCRSKLNLELINIKTGESNTEYLFRKR